MRRRETVAVAVALAVSLGLWLFPYVVFRSPGANDAMVLADLTLPMVAANLLGSVAALVVGLVRRRSSGSVALGTFLIGVAAAFLISLAAIGNMSDDRFMPLLFLPVPFGAVGIVVLITGLTQRTSVNATRGLIIGAIASVVLIGWLLARGSRDWLLAPYGFDVYLLIALEATVAYLVGAAPTPDQSTVRARSAT